MLSLMTMTESKLKVLRREVEAAIDAKITARRQEIESELSRLSLLDRGGRPNVVRAAAKRMGAAKYRKPASASKAAGRKMDAPLVAASPKASTSAKRPRKARKTNKVRNADEIAQAVVLTSAKIEHTEPLRIEPLDCPLPVGPLSQAIPGDLGGAPIGAVAP
jgi:hypothetical protein